MPVRHLETPDRYLGPRIKFLYHAFNRKVMETARANGAEELTSMHGRILGYLYWSRPKDVYQKDIEEHFNITRSSVAGIVKLMEQKGYILRQSVQGDARLKKLSLTDLGTRACEQSMEAFHHVEGLAIRGLSPEQVETFLSLCDAIQTNLIPQKECAHAKNHSVPSQGV